PAGAGPRVARSGVPHTGLAPGPALRSDAHERRVGPVPARGHGARGLAPLRRRAAALGDPAHPPRGPGRPARDVRDGVAVRRGDRPVPGARGERAPQRDARTVLMDELRAALAIARKDIRNVSRYRFSVASSIFTPLYQGILPGLLFGASFAVGGRVVGLDKTI